MSDINCIHFTGRLGQDPELKYFESGKVVATFSVAVEEYQGKEKPTKTNWFPCKAWNKTAEFVGEYGKKGSFVSVEGSLQFEKYQTAEGKNATFAHILIGEIKIVSRDKQPDGY